MNGCELFMFLLTQKNIESDELKLAIDLMAKDIGNQELVIKQNKVFSDYLFTILNQNEEIKAIKVDEKIVVRRRRFYE